MPISLSLRTHPPISSGIPPILEGKGFPYILSLVEVFLLTPCWTFSYPEVLAHGSLFPGGLRSPGWVMALWPLTAPWTVLLWQCMDFLLSWTQSLAPPWSAGFLALFTTGVGPQEILDISLLSEAMARLPHLLQDFLGTESTCQTACP